MTPRLLLTLFIYAACCLAIVAWQPVAVFFSIYILFAAGASAYMVWLVKTRAYHRFFTQIKNISSIDNFNLWLSVVTGAMVFATFIAAGFISIAFIYAITYLVNFYVVIPHIQNS